MNVNAMKRALILKEQQDKKHKDKVYDTRQVQARGGGGKTKPDGRNEAEDRFIAFTFM